MKPIFEPYDENSGRHNDDCNLSRQPFDRSEEIELEELAAEARTAFDHSMQATIQTWRDRHEEEVNRANARNAVLWQR